MRCSCVNRDIFGDFRPSDSTALRLTPFYAAVARLISAEYSLNFTESAEFHVICAFPH